MSKVVYTNNNIPVLLTLPVVPYWRSQKGFSFSTPLVLVIVLPGQFPFQESSPKL